MYVHITLDGFFFYDRCSRYLTYTESEYYLIIQFFEIDRLMHEVRS